MRKLLRIFMVIAILATSAVSLTAKNEDGSYTQKELKEFSKQAKKEAKNKAKSNAKEGWKYNGSTSLEMRIYKHLLKLDDFGGNMMELVGNANDLRSVSLGGTSARLDAIRKYAQQCRLALNEKIEGLNSALTDDQREKLIDGYEARVAQELSGELKLSYELYKKMKNGKYDVTVYYLVDEEGAKKARIRALQAEAEITKLTTEIANEISKFVNE